MSNSNHNFVGLPALIKNAAASDPIVSAGDNHISGIGFFDAISGGTVNRNDLSINFRNTNFLAFVGTDAYLYTNASLSDPDWQSGSNWAHLTTPDLTQALNDIASNATNIGNNASDISTNSSSISTNAGNISTNAGNITTNTNAISTNAGDISTLQTDLAQEILDRSNGDASLLTQIQSNDSDILGLTTDVANNTGAIQSNASAISSNVGSINQNATDIATNAGDITTLNTSTVKKTDSIDELADVDTSTTAPSLGEVLVWNNTNWVPGTTSNVGSLDDLSDVDLTSTLPELGQVLFYNGTNWIPEYPEVTVEAKNATATNFTKGQAVYVSGTAASGKPEIQLADNNGVNTYPAIGLLYDDINAGDEGLVVISGSIFGLDTSTYIAGDALYIDSTPGDLTTTKPTGTSQIQKVAIVKRSAVSAGSLIVMGAGRVNDLPNLPTGEYWRGSSTGVPQPQSFDTDVGNSTQVQLNIGAISTNASNISTNATDIAANAGDIATNTSNIATNASDISTLQTDTAGNLTGSVTVHSDVTNAGSGQIITGPERTLLNSAVQPNDNVSGLTNDANYITALQAPVQDVNGQSGNVSLDADDIDDSTTAHKFTTASDITKLAGIETNATADQTAAEIKTAYESNANTNEFSDAEQTKLAGIASGATANQTDAYLLDRANHTGTQAANTITGLATVATTGDSTDLIDSADLIRDTDSISALSFQTQPSTGTVPYLGGVGWTAIVPWQQLTFTPTTGSNVITSQSAATLLLTSSDNSVTITGSTSTLDFTATGGGGSSNQRTLTVPTGNGYSGDVVTFGSTPSGGFTVGEMYYYASTAAWEEAYGTVTTTSTGMLGICVNTSTPEILVRGIIKSSAYAMTYTTGRRLYVSTLQGGSGKFMDSVPSSPPQGAVIRTIGYVIDGVNGVIMFDPSPDYITVA